MERDWRRLGRALAEAREAIGLTQADVAAQLRVSLNPVQTIERGASKRVTSTMRAYAHLVGWTPESVEKVLESGKPERRPDAGTTPPASVAEFPTDLPLRIVKELREGPLLETTVIDLGEPGKSGRAIVVVRGNPQTSPEQVAEDLKEWARRDLKLRGIPLPENNDGAAEA